MNQIREYRIIEWKTKPIVVKRVNQMISSGWQPYGNLQCVYDISNNVIKYIQVMVMVQEDG